MSGRQSSICSSRRSRNARIAINGTNRRQKAGSIDQVNLAAHSGQKYGILYCHIASAYYRGCFPLEKCSVTRCTVGNPGPGQNLLAFGSELSVVGSRRYDYRPGQISVVLTNYLLNLAAQFCGRNSVFLKLIFLFLSAFFPIYFSASS